MTREITYLGYSINSEGLRPSLENIRSVIDYPVLKSVHEVQRFVGMASYFRRFIKDFSIIAKPLYDIVKTKNNFEFNKLAYESFECLQSKLVERPMLSIYLSTLETELHCDASSQGYGVTESDALKKFLFSGINSGERKKFSGVVTESGALNKFSLRIQN